MSATTFVVPPAASRELLDVQDAALRAVAYADVFDYPLDADEIHRYLHAVAATRDATDEALAVCLASEGPLRTRDGFYTLPGREHLVEERRRRAAHAEKLWLTAIRYGELLGSLPFVRMVAVTGSLAWDNTDDSADIDYLVVTEPGRLWISRLLVRVVAHVARRRGVKLCTNYLLSERALALADRNLCTAYDLVRMSPVAGFDHYRRMRDANAWTEAYLPNALGYSTIPISEPPSTQGWVTAVVARVARFGEWILRSGVGGFLERIEMTYRIRKIRRKPIAADRWLESEFGVDCFKDHPNAYQRRTMSAFAERLGRLAVLDP